MNKPTNTDDPQRRDPEEHLDPRDMVPAAGKSAARPSEVERRASMNDVEKIVTAPDSERTPSDQDPPLKP